MQIHVVYSFPSDGADRFAQVAQAIVSDLAAVDAWWVGQDPTRRPRFDLADLPNCDPSSTLSRLDLSHVQLPHQTSYYSGQGERFSRVQDDIAAAGFVDPDKKYLVFYDGSLDQPLSECGRGQTGFPDSGGLHGNAIIFITSVCGAGLGAALFPAVAFTHELIHALNALPSPFPSPGPPHRCPPPHEGHVCDSTSDILYWQSGGDPLGGKVLDFGHDDYYGHSGSWWDVQDSPFLIHLDSSDQTAPTAPAGLTVTSDAGGAVSVTWSAAADASPVGYRVYENGDLAATVKSTSSVIQARNGQTVMLAVRAIDPGGLVGPAVTISFTVGLGIVDGNGALVKDTVPPTAIVTLRGAVTAKALVLRWSAARDLGGLQGYRVTRNGGLYRLVAGTTLTVPRKLALGRWSVLAVDRAGNRGVSATVTVKPR